MPRDLAHLRESQRARWYFWRGLALVLVFGSGMAGFLLGAEVSDREIAGAGLLAKVYYTVGLFVLGGLDLGTPSGGSPLAQALLWLAYFAAPAITASAVVEGVLRAVDPQRWRLRRLHDHLIIAGCGRLGMLILRRLREVNKHAPVVMVEARADHPSLVAARQRYHSLVVTGDITARTTLDVIRASQARRILLVTGDDFANLDAAAKMLAEGSNGTAPIATHVADLRFKRLMSDTRVSRECDVFNIYQIAAVHLCETELLPHFERTAFRDVIVLVGFGRLGQTVLDELQRRAPEALARVIIVDTEARSRAAVFDEQIGFTAAYERHVIDASADDPSIWHRLDAEHSLGGGAPVFLLAAGSDALNVQIALLLGRRYPTALVLARSYFRSPFADEVSADGGFRTFNIADLILDSMPAAWLD